MEKKNKCIIWGTEITDIKTTKNDRYIVDSPSAGGKYMIDLKTYLMASSNENRLGLDPEKQVRLSGYIAKENLYGKTPYLNSIMEGVSDKKWLEKLPPIPSHRERAYLLLEGLVKQTNNVGKNFETLYFVTALEKHNDQFRHILDKDKKKYRPFLPLYPLSYSTKEEEIKFFLNYLEKLDFIKKDKSYNFQVTVEGFEKNHELSKSNHSRTVFIAMWFDEKVDHLRDSIEKAVEKTGYKPVIIDKEEHLNKIVDEILLGIKKARFIVCDLTSKKGTQRGSVYFEAGYAMGKDIPVILTCDKKLEKEIAFDIQNYNCLFWEKGKSDDFIERLQHRIEHTIGILKKE